MYILIVEDEPALADTLGEMMRDQHATVDTVYNGEDGLFYAENGAYDIILLDIMLPKMDGFEVVRRLREKKIQTPIILLTARDDTSDKVRGLNAGADDYITKPFVREELLARIRANARRTGDLLLDELSFADLTLHLTDCELQCGQKSVKLGFKELEIFKLLAATPTKVIPKNELLIKVWGYLSNADDNHVEVYISFLRKKLSFLESTVGIETVRRIGYRLAVAPKKDGIS